VAEPTTLPRLLQRNARDFRNRPAIREKDRGIWQTYTWAQYHDNVRDFAHGLAVLGFTRGAKLSVIGDNRPRLYWAQIAAQALGGVSVPVYQDSIARELAYVWKHAEVSVIVAEDQEQVDKVLALKDQLPALRLVIFDDPRGMTHYRQDWLRAFPDIQALGREFEASHPRHFEDEVDRGRPEDVAMIAYTSGTTGNPKGAMLTHANAVETARIFMQAEDVRPDDEWLSYLPMAWVGDAIYSLVLSLAAGFCCNCPESPETVQRDLRELGPTTLLAPPRIWENMLASVQVRAADATPLKRAVFDRFRAAAEPDEAEEPSREREWDEAAVERALVVLAVRAAQGVRRATWIARLAESTVTFREPALSPAGTVRVLTIARGRIAERTTSTQGAEPPVPPGFARPRGERCAALTVADYDRLRVLTTELRRTVGAGDPAASIRFGPRVALRGEALARVLSWV